jgi:hypothetical protein
MKFGKYLIATLPDFRRHFDLNQFLKNRYQFVLDMHPDKVYYWDNSLLKCYEVICKWINDSESHPMADIPENVKVCLEELTGNADVLKSISERGESQMSFLDDIIYLEPDQDISLPAFSFDDDDRNIDIRLHKIVASEDSRSHSTVRIANRKMDLAPGEVLYATECGGNFIEILPNKRSNNFFRAELIDHPGKFSSILVVEDLKSGDIIKRTQTLCFALTSNGCISVDSYFELDYGNMQSIIPTAMLEDENLTIHPVIVKSESDKIVGVLYNDGTLRTTNSFDSINGVFSFDLDNNKMIINNK